jgi:hypothetical protein
MSNSRADRLQALKIELEQTPAQPWAGIKAWIAKATPVIRSDWSDFLTDFQEVTTTPSWTELFRAGGNESFNRRARATEDAENAAKAENAKQSILNFLDGLLVTMSSDRKDTALDTVLLLCNRFPVFARQLETRMRDRQPIGIQDEYDVQYLLLALLRLHFDDVRKEVWTPSYAGGSARMDFLLKREEIVVEAKKTRDTLKRDSQIGDQLIIDIERYAQYPDCRMLVCFVYDPDMLLDNPKGLEQDLSGPRENIEVIVVVSPSGA